MIAHLTGILASKDPSTIIIEVSGVGYGVQVPVSTLSALPAVGERTSVHIYTYVREDTFVLYGFASAAEKALFAQLIGVSGIGPKVALAILSLSSPADIKTAIGAGDTAFLTSVPGIGQKTAERVVVDLRDKVDTFTESTDRSATNDVTAALVGLGYSNTEARKAVGKVDRSLTASDDILRAALKELAR